MVGVEARQHPVELFHEDMVIRRLFQYGLGDSSQEDLGVVVAGLPKGRVESVEQAADTAVPAVEQVVGQLFDARQPLWNDRPDFHAKFGFTHTLLASRQFYCP